MPHLNRSQGFTLLELMITVAVAGILLGIAIPSFNQAIISNKLTTTSNNLVYALTMARSESIKRNAQINIATDGEVSITAGSPAVKTILNPAIPIPTSITITNTQALVATPSGIITNAGVGFTGLAADISSTRLSTDNHRCVYLVTGVSITTCTDSNNCGAAPSGTCK